MTPSLNSSTTIERLLPHCAIHAPSEIASIAAVFAPVAPRESASLIAFITALLLIFLLLWRARHSSRPALLYTCAIYMALLHTVWIAGLLTSHYFESGFATLTLLTFPWSMAAMGNMTMAGFTTLSGVLLNYARFVLGFGGLQCLLLTLFVWELRLRPRSKLGRCASGAARPERPAP